MKEHKPLYLNSFEEAQRTGEMELYRESHNENIACAQAIRKALADNFDGYHLKSGTEKKIIEDFGFDRTMYVLANTIQHFNYDGRISIYNKDWADVIVVPDNKFGNSNRNVDFLIENPGLVNILASEVRDRYRELNLWDSSHCNPARELNFENKVMVLKPDTLKDEYKTPDYQLILSIIVGTFSSNIHTLMRSYLRNYSIAASLPWEEARHWKYISACCSNS